MAADASLRNPCIRQHLGEDIAIQHTLHRNALGSGFDASDAADGIDQSLAMVRTGAAQQSTIDIEKNQCCVGQRVMITP